MENAAADLISRLVRTNDDDDDDAIIDAIVLSACADGISEEELAALTKMVSELPSMAGKGSGDVAARIQASFERVERDGLEGRLKEIATHSEKEETRRRMFTAAAIIQYADGHVTNEENEFLLDFADVLGLDEPTVREIIAQIESSLEA